MNAHKHTEHIFYEILALKAANSSLSAQMGFEGTDIKQINVLLNMI